MFIGDILQACDNVNPLLMSLTMNEAGAHAHINAAILEETDNFLAEVRFEDLTVKVPYNKMRQGSKEAPPISVTSLLPSSSRLLIAGGNEGLDMTWSIIGSLI